MKRELVREGIIFAIVVLFTYTSANKLIDHSLFVFQMRLSPAPLMKTLAPFLSWVVPLAELLIVGLLVYNKTKLLGLYAALSLFILFEVYITAIFFSSDRLPCACGGVISLLSWKGHVLLNAIFIAITIIAIRLYKKTELNSDLGLAT